MLSGKEHASCSHKTQQRTHGERTYNHECQRNHGFAKVIVKVNIARIQHGKPEPYGSEAQQND